MAEIKQSGEQFSSRWGMLFSVLGMVVGTGAIWRFSREVAANNGGAFLLMLFVASIIWGVPLIIAESVFGKKSRFASTGSFKMLVGEKWTCFGGFAAMVCCLIAAYYGAVLGWLIKYLFLIATGFLNEVAVGGAEYSEKVWNDFAMVVPAWGSVGFFVLSVLIGAVIVSRGIQAGIEKANKVLIPAVYILLVALVIRVAFIPGAIEGFKFMYHIDFKDFADPQKWLAAFTQAAWGTGAGWGLFQTYFVYSRKDEDVQLNSLTAVFGLTSASMLAGMAILPAVFALAPDPLAIMASGNNGMTFIHLTNLFANTSGGTLMAVFFFLAVASAALSSLIGMFELGCRNLMDMGFTRRQGTVIITLFFLVVGGISAADNRVFNNQDFVWGVGLLLVGLFYAVAAMKIGIDKLWKEDIDPCSDTHFKWMWTCIKFFPIWFVAVWGFWVYESYTWYPDTWYKFWPITEYQYTPGAMVSQWALLFLILYVFNARIANKFHASNANIVE